MAKPILYIVRGLPGAGKSTFCRQNFRDLLILENDKLAIQAGVYDFYRRPWEHVIQDNLELLRKACCAQCDVVICNTFVTRAELAPILAIAEVNGYEYRILKVVGDYGSTHSVPAETLQKMKDKWEDVPGEEEVYSTRNRFL